MAKFKPFGANQTKANSSRSEGRLCCAYTKNSGWLSLEESAHMDSYRSKAKGVPEQRMVEFVATAEGKQLG